jgi:hypothetical protein
MAKKEAAGRKRRKKQAEKKRKTSGMKQPINKRSKKQKKNNIKSKKKTIGNLLQSIHRLYQLAIKPAIHAIKQFPEKEIKKAKKGKKLFPQKPERKRRKGNYPQNERRNAKIVKKNIKTIHETSSSLKSHSKNSHNKKNAKYAKKNRKKIYKATLSIGNKITLAKITRLNNQSIINRARSGRRRNIKIANLRIKIILNAIITLTRLIGTAFINKLIKIAMATAIGAKAAKNLTRRIRTRNIITRKSHTQRSMPLITAHIKKPAITTPTK